MLRTDSCVLVLCCSKNADHASVCGEAVPIVCHLSDALLKSFVSVFFLILKVFTGRNFEGRTLRLFAFESLFIPKQNLVFFSFREFCASSVDFSKTKIRIFENFCFSIFFSKNNLDDHFKKTRNCEGTHRLPNKTNRNVLASKLRPVKTFQKR